MVEHYKIEDCLVFTRGLFGFYKCASVRVYSRLRSRRPRICWVRMGTWKTAGTSGMRCANLSGFHVDVCVTRALVNQATLFLRNTLHLMHFDGRAVRTKVV